MLFGSNNLVVLAGVTLSCFTQFTNAKETTVGTFYKKGRKAHKKCEKRIFTHYTNRGGANELRYYTEEESTYPQGYINLNNIVVKGTKKDDLEGISHKALSDDFIHPVEFTERTTDHGNRKWVLIAKSIEDREKILELTNEKMQWSRLLLTSQAIRLYKDLEATFEVDEDTQNVQNMFELREPMQKIMNQNKIIKIEAFEKKPKRDLINYLNSLYAYFRKLRKQAGFETRHVHWCACFKSYIFHCTVNLGKNTRYAGGCYKKLIDGIPQDYDGFAKKVLAKNFTPIKSRSNLLNQLCMQDQELRVMSDTLNCEGEQHKWVTKRQLFN